LEKGDAPGFVNNPNLDLAAVLAVNGAKLKLV
jgi:hypothetical protein